MRLKRFRRRHFMAQSAAGVSVLATGCTSSDDAASDGTDSDDGAGTGSSGGNDTDGDDTGVVDESGSETGAVNPLGFEPDAIPESAELFPRTVFSGSMTDASVIITGHTTEPGDLRVIVWQTSEDGALTVAMDEAQATDAEGFIKITVEGLDAGQWYDYGLFVDGDDGVPSSRSLLGRVRTALAADSTEPVTVALAACIGVGTLVPDFAQPGETAPKTWPSMTALAQYDYDMLIHLGDQGYMDFIFEDGGTYEQYLQAWGTYHSGGYREVMPRSGMLCTWDDHEVSDNDSVDRWTTDPELRERISNGERAYFTTMPVSAVESGDRLWGSFQWGQTVEFIVLDCRSERTSIADGQYISPEQMEFLLDRLANSPCHFKAIVNSVPFASMPEMLGVADRWEGYVESRAQVNDFIADNAIERVVWLSGDIHLCYLGRTELAGGMWELAVTSGNIDTFAEGFEPEQFDWVGVAPHIPIVTFDSEANEVRVAFHDLDGNVAHEQTLTF